VVDPDSSSFAARAINISVDTNSHSLNYNRIKSENKKAASSDRQRQTHISFQLLVKLSFLCTQVLIFRTDSA
jgi:hypothetical protein